MFAFFIFNFQFGGKRNKKIGYKRFKKMLLSNCEKPMDEQKLFLQNKFEEWKGNNEQIDDVLILGVRVWYAWFYIDLI